MTNYNMQGANIAGAVGDNSQASDFSQSNAPSLSVDGQTIEFDDLLRELALLKAQLSTNPRNGDPLAQVSSSELEVAVGAVEAAAGAAEEKDGSGVTVALRKGGTWLFGFAERVGAAVVASIIRQSAGLP